MAIIKLNDDPFKIRDERGICFDPPTPIIKWKDSERPTKQQSINDTDYLTYESIKYGSSGK